MAATIYGTPLGGVAYSSSSIVVTVPAALNGYTQTVVLSIRDDFSRTTVTAPSGWTLRQSIDPGTGTAIEDTPRALFYSRKVTADTAEGTQTWTLGAEKEFSWAAFVATEDYSTHAVTEAGAYTDTWTAPTVTVPTVSGTDALHVSLVTSTTYARTVSAAPAGYTAMSGLNTSAFSDSYCSIAAAHKAVGTGATGTTSWTMSAASSFAALSIVYTTVAGGSTFTITGGGQLSLDEPIGGSGPLFRNRFSFPTFSL